jgi:N-acetylglucosaminyldiphosphoundecaprenol N-acetyl-beta-D-mannosaminyltransferase
MSNQYTFLGVKVNDLTIDDLPKIINKAVINGIKYIIGHHNLHSLYIYHHDETMRKFYKKTNFIHIDGMPIIWLGKLFGYKLNRKHRLTSLDWLPFVLEYCAKQGYKVFFLGSKPGVSHKAADYFVKRIPGLIVETHHGYFDANSNSNENKKIIEKINTFAPHVVMVGMGMPRQERWIYENYKKINANILWSLGAFMDYYAGEIPTPPRWLGRIGLEWAFRLFSEPKRLYSRYLIEPWFIIKLIIKEISNYKR